MASTGHGQRDPQSSSDLLARVGVFVGLFGIGLSTLLATVAVQERLGPLWCTLLLSLGIALVLGGGAGSIYSLVAAGRRSAAGKSSWRVFRGVWTYPRATTIAAGVLTSVILAVSLLFIFFWTGTPLTMATSTTLAILPDSPVPMALR
jgi:membrane-associated protease RseP (regulator of RpoE activity)